MHRPLCYWWANVRYDWKIKQNTPCCGWGSINRSSIIFGLVMSIPLTIGPTLCFILFSINKIFFNMVCLSYRMHWEARNLQAWTLNLNTNTMLVSQTNGTTNVPYRCVYPHNYFLTPPPQTVIDYYTVFIPTFTLQIHFYSPTFLSVTMVWVFMYHNLFGPQTSCFNCRWARISVRMPKTRQVFLKTSVTLYLA